MIQQETKVLCRAGKRLKNRRGTAVVEVALLMPWIAFLFVGVFDFGFYSYAAIATQNAARAAAIQLASGATNSCAAALAELRMLPNTTGLTTCTAAPVQVSDLTLTNATTPPCADCSLNTTATSRQATVTYQSIPLVPIPGILTGRLSLTRIAEVRKLDR